VSWASHSLDRPRFAVPHADQPRQRVFLLGPSHHAYLSGVALSRFDEYATPLGNLKLCHDTIAKLRATGAFSDMKASVDEAEHSLEMHLPYIRHVFAG
jgi:AmmeMemoRadiSam system protein B